MEKQITKLLGHKKYSPATLSELLRQLNFSPENETALQRALRDLERRGLVVRLKGGRYLSSESPSLVSGRIQITKGGRGFLTPDDPARSEIAIPSTATGTALHEDRVVVLCETVTRSFWKKTGTEEPEQPGVVVSILERRRTRFVGTFQQGSKGLFVLPDDPRFSREIRVSPPQKRLGYAKSGEKVVVELLRWDSRHTAPEGRIVEILGAVGKTGVDMLGVLRQYDLTGDFPEAVLKEARRFGAVVKPSDLKGRRDCRDHFVFTIDPDDARDFDDAICLQRAGAGRWKLWVHIADVSHYVKAGSPLDQEAKRRGNSSYLVDRVIPMLPEELSNELCSLKPRVDRLTKCVEFLLNDEGKVLQTDFYPAVIQSKQRLTYAEALQILENPVKGELAETLHQAGRFAQAIRKRRFEAGSLDLDFPETKIRLDGEGRISSIEQHGTDASHQLIEEFMLLANEAVATRLMKLKKPAIYRTHEAPDPGRLAGYREDPLGHYGLAKKKYAHFTSPIRRYADLVVHRSLFSGRGEGMEPQLHQVADHLSSSERNSADAERDSKDVKLYAYLTEQIRSEKRIGYSAQVTSLREFGFFVDIPGLGMSAMVPLAQLADDHYQFDSVAKRIQGRSKRRTIRIGDIVEVEIAKVDSTRKMVDFRLAGSARSRREPVGKKDVAPVRHRRPDRRRRQPKVA